MALITWDHQEVTGNDRDLAASIFIFISMEVELNITIQSPIDLN